LAKKRVHKFEIIDQSKRCDSEVTPLAPDFLLPHRFLPKTDTHFSARCSMGGDIFGRQGHSS
jgi:hypothetical protein